MSRYVKKYPNSLILVCSLCGHEYLFIRYGKSSLTYHVLLDSPRCSCNAHLVAGGVK